MRAAPVPRQQTGRRRQVGKRRWPVGRGQGRSLGRGQARGQGRGQVSGPGRGERRGQGVGQSPGVHCCRLYRDRSDPGRTARGWWGSPGGRSVPQKTRRRGRRGGEQYGARGKEMGEMGGGNRRWVKRQPAQVRAKEMGGGEGNSRWVQT